MEYLQTVLFTLSGWVRPHISPIAVTLVATLLVIFGGDINRAVQELIRKLHFVLRVAVFMAVCAFGYGALMNFVAPLIAHGLHLTGEMWMGLAVVFAFFIVGLIAERRRYGS